MGDKNDSSQESDGFLAARDNSFKTEIGFLATRRTNNQDSDVHRANGPCKQILAQANISNGGFQMKNTIRNINKKNSKNTFFAVLFLMTAIGLSGCVMTKIHCKFLS
jgi:hypothetical protein